MILAFVMTLGGCRDVEDFSDVRRDDPFANFDCLAKVVDSRYCYFADKGVDWARVTRHYRSRITRNTDPGSLYVIMAEMLDMLKDGHVNLIAPFATSYYKKWWSDYPQDFDNRCLQQYYLGFGGLQTGSIQYVIFVEDKEGKKGRVGYMRCPSFSTAVSETALDYILTTFRDTDGMIIDVRDNGGGLLTNVGTIVGRFIDHKIVGGFIRHKTGPAHDAFSEPYAVTYSPSSRVHYNGPVAVLTNRSTFSAANDFVSVMKQLPQVTVIGARTGGGGGLPFSSELPNGWAIRFSASPISDANGVVTEFGIDPTADFEVHCTAADLAAGHDAILDRAISYIRSLGKAAEGKE